VHGKLWPPDCSPKNDLLVGAPAAFGMLAWLDV
jgi:hypothetical protein